MDSIGSALLPRLRADGHRVVRLVRGEPEGSDDVRWDPEAGTIDAAGLEGVDAVVHLAGAGIGDKKWTPGAQAAHPREPHRRAPTSSPAPWRASSRPPTVLRVGLGGRLLRQPRAPRSSPRSRRRATTSPPRSAWPGRPRPPRPRRPGSGWCTSAPASCWPPTAARSTGCSCPFKLGLGGRIGSGDQYMSWITLDDHVGAIRHLLTTDSVSGPVNLTAPNPVTNAEFTQRARRRGAPPDRAADAAAPVEGGVRRRARAAPARRRSARASRACWSDAASSSRTRELDDALRAVLAAPAAA